MVLQGPTSKLRGTPVCMQHTSRLKLTAGLCMEVPSREHRLVHTFTLSADIKCLCSPAWGRPSSFFNALFQ